MQLIRATLSRAIPFVIISTSLIGCRAKSAIVAIPRPDARIAELVAQGDSHLLESHLYGWRQAEASYRQAYELGKTDEIERKLLLTRFLMLIRQSDEEIPDPMMDETLKSLCAGAATERDKALCGIAQWYSKGPGTGQREGQDAPAKDQMAKAAFDRERSALEAYLYLLFSRAYGMEEPPPGWEALSGKFKDSPLFIYLDLSKRGLRGSDELQKSYPQFAEMFEFTGELLFQKKKYNGARSDFRRAAELIPDYTRALNGLGNIYFFALEDFEKALEYYEDTLKWDPSNTAALFGKGAVLHQLGRYDDSNAALDMMLRSDLSRKGRVDPSRMRYYQGEAHYLKAYNHYLVENPEKARELVEIAKTFLPDSEEINYLSGLLYFESKDMEAARADLLRVIERGNSNCNAQYYLGLIYRERKGTLVDQPVGNPRIPRGDGYDKLMKFLSSLPAEKEPAEKKALNYFLGAGSCMATAARNLSEQINSVPTLDLEAAEKVILRGRLEKKLFDHRVESAARIESILKAISNDDIPGKQNYVDLLSEILNDIRAAIGSR